MSTDQDQKLIRMANQIAGFFDTQPGEDAAAMTAQHLRDFWDPRMLARLFALLDAGNAQLGDTARAAAERLATERAA